MWGEDFSKVTTSNLYQVNVPKQYSGKKYSKLFDYLTTRRNMIPIGLYRKQKFDMAKFMKEEGSKNNKPTKKDGLEGKDKQIDEQEVSYVTTNPLKHTKLQADDKVFVLAQGDPGDTTDTWDDYKQFKELQTSLNEKHLAKSGKVSGIGGLKTEN